jgi:hypothetical protein
MVAKSTKTEQKQEKSVLDQLFGSSTRVSLMRLFLENPERSYYVREITRKVDAQLNSVRRELNRFVDMELVREVEGTILKGEKKSVNKKYYSANTDFIFYNELRGIVKKSAVFSHDAFLDALPGKHVKLLCLTGSFVEADVSTDMIIVGKVSEKKLKEAISAFEKELGKEVNYTCMPEEEFQYRRDVNDRFLNTILKAEKIILKNTIGIEL